MKIFSLQSQYETEWVAARTNIEAIKAYCSITGTDLVELDDEDEIKEVPESEWDNLFIRNEDGKALKSFRERMKEVTKPDIICGNMY